MVNAEITISNLLDNGLAEKGYIKPGDVRTVTVTAVADTGAMHLVITEELREKLGLAVKEEKTAHVASGQQVPCQITEGVEVKWKNRTAIVSAMVIPGAKKVLFGIIPMESMDLMVNPVTQEVIGAHGDKEEHYALFYYF